MSAFTWPPESPPSADATPSPQVDPPAASADTVAAAVLVPLFLPQAGPEPYVVLTKRRPDLRRHAGEISFPGGRKDAEDRTLLDTALREAEEEIGLPRERVEIIGELPATSTFATRYTIHPFVAHIPAGVAWRLSPREVDAVLELPLGAVRAGAQRVAMERRGIAFETDAYVVDGHVIWGATARILAYLFERLPPAAGDGRLAFA